MRTTPVGVYPNGATPDGIQDMAGNVWEWTATRYAEYPYDPDANWKTRTQQACASSRGGGWAANRKMVRCAYRGWDYAGHGVNNYGFRLARISL